MFGTHVACGADGVPPVRLRVWPVAEADFLFEEADLDGVLLPNEKYRPLQLTQGIKGLDALPGRPQNFRLRIPVKKGAGRLMVGIPARLVGQPPRSIRVNGHFLSPRRNATPSNFGLVGSPTARASAMSRVIRGRGFPQASNDPHLRAALRFISGGFHRCVSVLRAEIRSSGADRRAEDTISRFVPAPGEMAPLRIPMLLADCLAGAFTGLCIVACTAGRALRARFCLAANTSFGNARGGAPFAAAPFRGWLIAAGICGLVCGPADGDESCAATETCQHPGMKFDLKFSIIEMMRDRLHAAPFQPFVVVLHSGERLRVKNPDVLTVTLSGWVIYDDGAKARMLNPALVAEIETKSAKV